MLPNSATTYYVLLPHEGVEHVDDVRVAFRMKASNTLMMYASRSVRRRENIIAIAINLIATSA